VTPVCPSWVASSRWFGTLRWDCFPLSCPKSSLSGQILQPFIPPFQSPPHGAWGSVLPLVLPASLPASEGSGTWMGSGPG
jgi:hypothetical protein